MTTDPGDGESWRLPADETGPEPAGELSALDGGPAGRVVGRLAVALSLLGVLTLAGPFLTLPHELVAVPALGFVLGWLAVWLIDRAQAAGRNTGLVAVRISAVVLVATVAPLLIRLLLLSA